MSKPKDDLNKAFENIEKHDIKVSTVFIPEDCADKVIGDLKKLSPKIKTKDDFYMEDVTDLALKAFEVIEEGLKKYGITLNDEQDDAIYVPICNIIEKHCINDYRNYN